MRTLLAIALAFSPAFAGELEAARAEAQRTGKPLMVVFRCVP